MQNALNISIFKVQGRVVQSRVTITHAGLVQNLNSDMKAWKVNSDKLFLSTTWWFNTLNRIEKIFRGNAFDEKKKETRVKI